jgi:Mn-containing catalase
VYHHVKKLMYTVNVGEPDPRFGNMLLEQFGGANGELAAAMQYSIQGLNCEDPAREDLLMDIGTEELSHLEVVGNLARLHLQPMKESRGGGSGPLPPGPLSHAERAPHFSASCSQISSRYFDSRSQGLAAAGSPARKRPSVT